MVVNVTVSVCSMCYVEAVDIGPICANQTDIDRMNDRVTEITTALAPIVLDQSMTEVEKLPKILNMICRDT